MFQQPLFQQSPANTNLQLHQHNDSKEASHLLQQALPALSSLQGSAFGKALAATATTVRPFQVLPTANLAAVPGAANAMAADAAEVIRGCALARHTLDWAVTEPTLAAAAALLGCSETTGSSSSSAPWSEQQQAESRAILLSGMSAVASRFTGENKDAFALFGAITGNASGSLTISQQVQICMGQGLGAGALGGGGFAPSAGLGGNLFEMLGGLLGTGNPFTASTEVQAAQGLPKGPDSSRACWACGRTAEAAAAAGMQLQRGTDGKVRLKKCSRCRVAHYCSAECQMGHWKAHKLTCVPVGTGSAAGAR